MPPTKPALARAAPGLPITPEGWNKVVGAIDGIYAALPDVAHQYLELEVAWRGRAVRDARVVGFPVDKAGKQAGPALEATPALGALGAYHVVGARPGRWRLLVDAPGFAPAVVELDAGTGTGTGTGSLAGGRPELARTTVPAPDLVGMSLGSTLLLTWARLPGPILDSPGGTLFNQDCPILLQGPLGTAIDRATTIYFLVSPMGSDRRPWRAVVPDFLGWDATRVAINLQVPFNLQLDPTSPEPGPGRALRVVAQTPAAGTIVPAGTNVKVEYGGGDPASAVFGDYSGTHRKLAKLLVGDGRRRLSDELDVLGTTSQQDLFNSPLFPATTHMAPWEVVRTYWSDADLDLVVGLFSSAPFDIKATDITDAPGEDLAAVWSSFIVMANL